eukprot:Hpha_TRINITY_DN15423_c4_g2::TRINITY_DN15423_c4_g2_i1::g.174638::m.174638
MTPSTSLALCAVSTRRGSLYRHLLPHLFTNFGAGEQEGGKPPPPPLFTGLHEIEAPHPEGFDNSVVFFHASWFSQQTNQGTNKGTVTNVRNMAAHNTQLL